MESPYPDGNYDPILDGENILEPETDILKLDDGNFEAGDTELTFENEKMDPTKDENNSAVGEEEQEEIEVCSVCNAGHVYENFEAQFPISMVGQSTE